MKSYKELIVWQKSIILSKEVYILTEKFPKSEIFGITSQMRRAVVSIASNIAEGYTRGHRKEYLQFLSIAFGSGAELETQVAIVKELDFGEKLEYQKIIVLLDEVMRMLNKLISSLKNSNV
jgi:four helix bundle protein